MHFATLFVKLCSLLYEGQLIFQLAKRGSRVLKNIRKTIKRKVDGADSLSISIIYTLI